MAAAETETHNISATPRQSASMRLSAAQNRESCRPMSPRITFEMKLRVVTVALRCLTRRHRSTVVSNKALPRAADGVGRRVPGASKQPSKMTDDDGLKLVSGKKVRKNGTHAVIGMRKGKHELKAKRGRYLSVFISRLDPTVTADELSVYIKSEHNLDAKCVKLKNKT